MSKQAKIGSRISRRSFTDFAISWWPPDGVQRVKLQMRQQAKCTTLRMRKWERKGQGGFRGKDDIDCKGGNKQKPRVKTQSTAEGRMTANFWILCYGSQRATLRTARKIHAYLSFRLLRFSDSRTRQQVKVYHMCIFKVYNASEVHPTSS